MTVLKDVRLQAIAMLIEELSREIQRTKVAQSDAMTEAKHHKGAMESRYDTFKEEAQYLHAGHMKRQVGLENELALLASFAIRLDEVSKVASSEITMGSLICLDDESGSSQNYFIVPGGGGRRLDITNIILTSLGIDSPLARALIGRVEGDEVEVTIQGSRKFLLVSSIV